MLTGQESIADLIKRFPKAKKVLRECGIAAEAAKQGPYKNLAHAAIAQKLSLQKILQKLSAVTGEPVRATKVSGMGGAGSQKTGLRRGTPEGIKRVLAVHSGKGGVGKTFVAINLALGLASKGARVGLLDADVDCPNVMKVLGLKGTLAANGAEKIVPLEYQSGAGRTLKVLSMAPMLKNEDDVLMWRGPIVSRVVDQFIHDTAWGELDFLVVDLPPGTSDIPLTIFHILEGAELIVVTTPQELALLDARRAIKMARQMNAKIIGLIENMSGEIFGGGEKAKIGGVQLSKDLKIPFLGSIPLDAGFAAHPLAGTSQKIFDQILKRSGIEH